MHDDPSIPAVGASVRLLVHGAAAADGSASFGRGVFELCRLVDECGSLNKAAHQMGMAYSKAWRIIKSTEESAGIALLERHGAHGSCLTPEGRRFLWAYSRTEEDLQRLCDELFGRYLAEWHEPEKESEAHG